MARRTGPSDEDRASLATRNLTDQEANSILHELECDGVNLADVANTQYGTLIAELDTQEF